MSIEINTPTLPESVADALIVNWFKKPGEAVSRDEPLVEVETDKVVLEVPSPVDGVLTEIIEDEGATVVGGQLLARVVEGAAAAAPAPAAEEAPAAAAPVAAEAPANTETGGQTSPGVRKALDEKGMSADDVVGSGKNGRILKEDVADAKPAAAAPAAATETVGLPEGRVEERVPMTRLRARIAERLLDATQSTAMLTTFNEVNMKPLMDLRKQYKDQFEKEHEARLGLMSMFVKAAGIALQRYPEVNASVDGNDIVYHNYCDIGIAVSSPRGLVVPILRNAERMSLADIEKGVAGFAGKARAGKLGLEDLQGGTFTITNGGVFGSLMSTPIINPPQSAILGMHGIKERPVAENGEVVIRPMMYIALSYDHRIIDGQGAVLCLRTIKELVEDPARTLLEI